jgi:hypothetical protein
MGFERGGDPYDKLKIGKKAKIEKWFIEHDSANSSIDVTTDSGITINVDGNMVLDNFDIKKQYKDIQLRKINGHITILDDLTTEELYKRIRTFYLKVLDNFLGKKTEDQEKILFPNKKDSFVIMRPDLIEKSEEYIRNLSDNPKKEELNDLAEKIMSGILEYGFRAKDKYGVKMNQYAKSLKKKIR